MRQATRGRRVSGPPRKPTALDQTAGRIGLAAPHPSAAETRAGIWRMKLGASAARIWPGNLAAELGRGTWPGSLRRTPGCSRLEERPQAASLARFGVANGSHALIG